jgi:hypothetical protein
MKKAWVNFWSGIVIALFFIAIIGVLGSRLNAFELLPDQGAFWYYWKLPEKEFWPRLTAWSFYIIHQLLVWLLIASAQFKEASKRIYYRKRLIFVNIFFVALHILQSHLFYDGLAQDVPVFSSQGSVIVMLVLILIMDNERRGLFFGKKITSLPIIGSIKEVTAFIQKYHGYFISWAIVYTFWYHPTIASGGHLVGFFYLFLLFIQMSMIYTPVHYNKKWAFVLEVLVLFHGTTVAIGQQNNMWPMFMFGFATMLVVTQIYGINLSKITIKTVQLTYLAGVFVVFGGFTGNRTIGQIHQVLWIPIIEYLLVFVFLFLIGGVLKIKKKS